jgi:glycosyltransferase involved in cell wall biosynthesis
MLSFALAFLVSLLVTLFIVRFAHLHEGVLGDTDLAGVQKFHARPVPRTLMEASAMGRPIVATDVPGCREVVAHGVNGFLCEVKSADSLATELERMLSLTRDERAALAERGREKVTREFDEKKVVERYKGTIHAITGISL